MYPSIFNPFPVILSVSLTVRHFNTFFVHFGLPWVRPWDRRTDGRRYGRPAYSYNVRQSSDAR